MGKGDFLKAGRYAVSGQQEAYERMAEQWRAEDRRQARSRRYEVKDVRSDRSDDSTAVSSCMLVVKRKGLPNDTVYRVVLLKKEGLRWKVNSGLLPQ
ncbi:MAG: hypothetical protein J5873_05510 [Bacteroidales bacterium]|nr:hypothetical protein [Bacteroidales bacterium]